MTSSRFYLDILLEGLSKNHENHQASRCSGRDSKRELLE
jgi:hypothetical protein